MAKIIIVDENDNPVGLKERDEVLPEDIYRVSALWITNSKGEILLAQRALNKSHDPGKWGPGVAGTLEKNETYESNIIKEAQEELGLKNVKLEPGPKMRKASERNYFCQWYSLQLDRDVKDFDVLEEEVAGVRWISRENLVKEFKDRPEEFLSNVLQWLKLFPNKPLK